MRQLVAGVETGAKHARLIKHIAGILLKNTPVLLQLVSGSTVVRYPTFEAG